MNKDFQPTIKRQVRTRDARDEDYVNTGLADETQRDRNALSSNETFNKLSSFYRITPVEMLKPNLLTVITTSDFLEGHEITSYSPVNMTEKTKVQLFGKELGGEVHFDHAVIQLIKSTDGNFLTPVVLGELPDWIKGIAHSSWSSAESLMAHLVRTTRTYYASLKQTPHVVHEDYRSAMKAKDYEQAAGFLAAGLEALSGHATGQVVLTNDEITQITNMIKTAASATNLHKHIQKAQR